MKTFLTKSKSSLVVVLLSVASFQAWSKPVAQVTALSGQVFVVSSAGKTSTVKMNDHIEEKSEIMVEEGATITLHDYYDSSYHLIGGSHLKFFNKSVQLKRGKAWIESQNERHPLSLVTANGHVNFSKAEFITTFDSAASRSQVLVVNGDVEVSNVLDKNAKYVVTAGTFTLIDPEVENGLPRAPTKVGLNSLQTALSEFKKLPKEMTSPAPSRKIASVDAAPAAPVVKKGEIIFITTRAPASVGEAYGYYKKSVVKKRPTPVTEAAPIAYYGVTILPAEAKSEKVAPRTPASIKPVLKSGPQSATQNIDLDQEFATSLKKKTEEQPKHSKELESLIMDLKSY